jgi:hypothetical protein
MSFQRMQDGVWVANYRFPLPGTWKAILTATASEHRLSSPPPTS